jgi:AraC family transcriptional regulator
MPKTVLLKMKEIRIKNMVCPRCIMAVESQLEKLKLPFDSVSLGKVVFRNELSENQISYLNNNLTPLGFEILKSKDTQLIESIKNKLQELVREADITSGFNLSDFLGKTIGQDYTKLSHLFSSMEGQTIEKFFIQLKIDKVREWLFYHELQLSEMAWKLGYSSVQHLSSQFKKITGMTPSDYKKLKSSGTEGWK